MDGRSQWWITLEGNEESVTSHNMREIYSERTHDHVARPYSNPRRSSVVKEGVLSRSSRYSPLRNANTALTTSRDVKPHVRKNRLLTATHPLM
jgi:hypothetical protein